jgi:uncharacterized protein (DUF427 family)
MKATIDGAVIGEAKDDQLVKIEGNWYFPPSSLAAGALSDSATPYTCPWKGKAQYHDVTTGGTAHHDAAWSYPEPLPGAIERVGSDFAGYVAFDRSQVEIG